MRGKNFHENKKKTTKLSGGSSEYYELPHGCSELQDLIEYLEMPWNIANIFKACYRYQRKEGNPPEYDIDKILWFAHREKNLVSTQLELPLDYPDKKEGE